MGARDVLEVLRADGLVLCLTPEGLSASPRKSLTEQHRAAIRANRALLINELTTEMARLPALIASIHRCCDARGDDDANRAGLIDGCALLTPVQQSDAREHFDQMTVLYTERGSR